MRTLRAVTDNDEVYVDSFAGPLSHDAARGDVGVVGVRVDSEGRMWLKPKGTHGYPRCLGAVVFTNMPISRAKSSVPSKPLYTEAKRT